MLRFINTGSVGCREIMFLSYIGNIKALPLHEYLMPVRTSILLCIN